MASKKKKTKRTSLRNNFVFILGILLLLSGFGLKEHRRRVLSFQGYVNQIQDVSNPPVRIEIPKTKTNLSIEQGSIVDEVWSISERGATHLITSSTPGNNNTTVIYAHNKNDLFGPIRWLNIGDEIIITSSDNQTFRYVIVETITTNPNAVEYVLPQSEETLTLYTCTGFADTDRYIVIAKLVANQI